MNLTNSIKVHEVKTDYDNVGRVYNTPYGCFHSVTTMLSNSGDKEFLQAWTERIGEEAAERQTKIAANIGTDFHELGERFLLNETPGKVHFMSELLFKKAIPILEENVTAVHAVEIPLWSKVLRLAGRTDAIVDWNGKLAVFDYKCIGHHNPEWLEDYWVQVTLYAYMLKEMYGLTAEKLVLVVANKKSLKVKYFESTPNKHVKTAFNKIQAFRKKLDIA